MDFDFDFAVIGLTFLFIRFGWMEAHLFSTFLSGYLKADPAKKRKELFEARKSAVETEIQELQKTLSLLKFKCWYYETAMKDGNEDAINAMLPDKLPENIQKLYNKGHE